MKIKKSKIVIIVVAVFFAIVIFIGVIYNQSLTDIENKDSILSIISYYENNKYGIKKDFENINYKIVCNQNYCAVFYENNGNNNTIILKESLLFSSKYKYFLSDSTTSSYGKAKYIFNDRGKFLYVVTISIREFNDFNGISKFCISKTNLNTDENTIEYREFVDSEPYFDLFVNEYETNDKYDLVYHVYDENNDMIF